MIKTIIVFLYLMVLSFCDIRENKVPSWMIWGGEICAFISFCANGVLQKEAFGEMIYECLQSVLPGIFFLMVAVTTGKAGFADGILLMTLGLLYGYRMILVSGCIGLWGMAMVSAGLLLIRRVKKDTKLPCIPFLTLGQAAGLLMLRQ